jgi:hypothetical protein
VAVVIGAMLPAAGATMTKEKLRASSSTLQLRVIDAA